MGEQGAVEDDDDGVKGDGGVLDDDGVMDEAVDAVEEGVQAHGRDHGRGRKRDYDAVHVHDRRESHGPRRRFRHPSLVHRGICLLDACEEL